jgi:hypothetical protein
VTELIVSPPPVIQLTVTAIPRVQLTVGSGGSGGGGAGTLTEVTSNDGTVDVAAGTGPVVDLSIQDALDDVADALTAATSGLVPSTRTLTVGTGLTGGGTLAADRSFAADFGSGAGKVTQGNDSRLSDSRAPNGAAGGDLGGTYPNPTVSKARALATTGASVDVVAGAPPSAGYILTASDATHAVWLPPPNASEFWAKPKNANSNDVEGDSSTLPAGFTLWDCTAGPPTAVTPLSGVDHWTNPAAGTCRIEANKDAKRSWVVMQPRGETRRWLYTKPVTLSGNNGWVIRARIATTTQVNLITADSSTIRLCAFKDNAGKPDITTQNGFQFGWESDTNAMNIQIDVWKAHAQVTITEPELDALTASLDVELVAILRAGAASQTWDFHVRSSTYDWYSQAATSGTIGIAQGDTVHFGFDFLGGTAVMPSAPILSWDYLRFEDTAANFLP